jgi:NADH dehydrogenase
MAWLLVHIFYLIDFRNRLLVLIDWAWSYFTYQRGSRLITGHRLDAGTPGGTAGKPDTFGTRSPPRDAGSTAPPV